MRKLIVALILSIGVFSLLTLPVSAAPAPWGIAINEDSGECAGYWAGDEFTSYPLPDGWEAYYPDFSGGDTTLEIPYGTCEYIDEEYCCEDLGFEYVSDNIGMDDIDTGMDLQYWMSSSIFIAVILGLCCLGMLGIVAVIIIVLLLKKKK